MKLENENFEVIAFLFEYRNGNKLGEYEKSIIEDNPIFSKFSNEQLEVIITEALNSKTYSDEFRISAYWALSKTNNKKLISHFRKWLQLEIESYKPIPVFQILIALDRLKEKAFHKKRDSRDYREEELNIQDAKEYLAKVK